MREPLRRRTMFSCGLLLGTVLCGVTWLIFGSTELLEAKGRKATAGRAANSEVQESNDVERLAAEVRRLTEAVRELNERVQRLQSSREPRGLSQTSPSSPAKKPRAPMPVYVRPALAQFNAMVAEIRNRIDELRQSGASAQADEMTKSLEKFNQLPAAKYSDVKTPDPEVHVVGVYEAASSRNHTNAPAKVRVTYTGGPIVLVLTSYEPVAWDVELADGVQVQTAIVCGYYRQEVRGLPESVPVLNNSHEGGSQGPRFYCYSKTSDGYSALLKGVRELSGLEVTSFQGAYRYPGTPFLIGPDNHDWRYQHIIAQMRDLHAEATQPATEQTKQAANELRFSAMSVAGADRYGHGGTASFGEFNVNGPIMSKMAPLPRGCNRVILDPRHSVYYAISGHGLIRFEKASSYEERGPFSELPMPVELPRLSWPCGLTFDTKRNRVLIATLGGEGFLYSYEPDTSKWSILASLQNVDYSGITYAPESDRLFGLAMSIGESSRPRLHRLTAEGAVEKTIEIGDPMPAVRHLTNCQLAITKDKLVILGPAPVSGEEHSAPTTHAYVVHPETGEVTYHTELQPQK